MPTRVCSVCGNLITWKPSSWRYEYKEPPFFCCAKCAVEWVLYLDGGQYPAGMEGCSYNLFNPLRTTDIYSPEFNIYFRSHYEVFVAKILDWNNLSFEYEKWFFKVGKTFYNPDFLVQKENGYVFIEVKGLFEPGAKKKIRLYHTEYGNQIPLVLFSWNLFSGFRKMLNESKTQ